MEFDIQKLNKYAATLEGLKGVITDTGQRYSNTVNVQLVDEYKRLLDSAETDLPGLLTPFVEDNYRLRNVHRDIFQADAINLHVITNLSIVKAQLSTASTTPVLVSKDFGFIQSTALRAILSRDYEEIQKSMISSSYKAAIILSGGSIEALLLDLLHKDDQAARASSKAPSESNLDKWHLNELIEVAVDTAKVGGEIAKLSHSVREYRNLIHPGVEVRGDLKVEPEEAKIAVEVLNILIRELSA